MQAAKVGIMYAFKLADLDCGLEQLEDRTVVTKPQVFLKAFNIQ